METARQRTEYISGLASTLTSKWLADDLIEYESKGYDISFFPIDWDTKDGRTLRCIGQALKTKARVDHNNWYSFFPTMEDAEISVAYDIYKNDKKKEDFKITDLVE